ncbi:aldose epimerase family protein [Bacillus sp. OK048]|uniref:aldose epimerase family protein n=1 Tax=Bacillus sp. OK048 TaxID=1882761 RepID=UPI0008890A6C|nr:aldose epimerase family protein [Bacillus sp. OK048]SDM84236.1 aldose 1-epimerase [Bacillus sp. OK048]
MKLHQEKFGELNGQDVTAYTLVNDKGMKVTCLDYGCIITKIMVPDQQGSVENVVLGFNTLEDYEKHSPYFGAVVGRVAGRIQGAQFELNDKVYQLEKNDHGNHLHGGLKGFDKVIWKAEVQEGEDHVSLVFSYLSKDGENGYPGNLHMKVIYTLNNKNEFLLVYEGVADQPTLLNVTNHTYFNLSGNGKRDIQDHVLQLKSRQFLELTEDLLPTGKILTVEDTPFDFTAGRMIQDGVVSEHPQNILAGNGYDHPFLLQENELNKIVLSDQESGRVLKVETDQPCVVLYTGNQLEGDFSINGIPIRKYFGLCLETQGMPDSIHHQHFPSCIIDKGQVYKAHTKWKFR